MATPRQRADLRRAERDLREAFGMINERFWATRDQRACFQVVLQVLVNWIRWEDHDDE
ncbi:hypothetical protein HD600_000206 [Microbacterium ginsengiterrae]|uniref:Uncharacterized protein n=1 Tax=Microbacterium ginsengiterrae TaxID=546115 RepID=A0A7W9C9V1_9MICO|nr:hypothetical protein [Microbacterium ginsengiterrae]